MIDKLLFENHLAFLSLKGGCTGLSESTLVKCHIVGHHMSQLKHAKFNEINVSAQIYCLAVSE